MSLQKTITFDELDRLRVINDPDIPVINDDGMRKRWVGIGWVDERECDGTETVLIRD